MTRGGNGKRSINSQSKKRTNPLTGFSRKATNRPAESSANLEMRMKKLEEELQALRERIDELDDTAPNYFGTGVPPTSHKKPGPVKNIEDCELFRSRDGLVDWLENVWPEIVKPLFAAKHPRAVAAILGRVARPKDLQPPWQSRFLAHPARLLQFLRSGKFNRKPPKKTVLDALNRPVDDERRKRAANRLPTRQIANAMAGLPKLSWSTSLDRCRKSPCPYPVANIAARHYRAMFMIRTEWSDAKGT